MKKFPKVVVTGVTGQLGSYFVDYLLEHTNYDIVGTVRRLSVENHKNINHVKDHPRFRLELMDLGDSNSIKRLISKEKPDYFINCAANSFVGTSWSLPEQHLKYNAVGVLHQLEAIKDHCPKCRYFNSGSSEEFGDVQFSPQTIDHPLRARSPYGASKIAARQLVKVYRDSYNMYALQPHCFNFELIRRGKEFITRKITTNIARIKKAIDNNEDFKPLRIGNISAQRDWNACTDFVDGIWRMLNQETHNKKLQGLNDTDLIKNLKEYVFASGKTHTVATFITLALKYSGLSSCNCSQNYVKWEEDKKNPLNTKVYYVIRDKDKKEVERKVIVEIAEKFYRPAEVELLLGDSSPARKDLKWHPKIKFTELVKMMVHNDLKEIGAEIPAEKSDE